jgi:hypothetical protein
MVSSLASPSASHSVALFLVPLPVCPHLARKTLVSSHLPSLAQSLDLTPLCQFLLYCLTDYNICLIVLLAAVAIGQSPFRSMGREYHHLWRGVE